MEKSSFKLENDKQNIFKRFFSWEKLSIYRIKAIRRTFLFLSLMFFLCYFFVGVSFYESFFSSIITKVYFLFVVVWVILSFYIVKDFVKNNILRYAWYIFFILVWIVAILPVFIKREFILSLFN